MSEAVSSKPAKAGNRWLNIVWRILVTLLLLFAVLGFLISLAGIVGVWYARSYARSAVIDVTTVTTKTLTTVNNGLGRVNTQVQDARQKVTQMNGAATLLGDRISSSPLVDKFSQLVSTTLAPSIEKVSTAATNVHDTFVAANSKLELLNGLPNVQIPTLPQLTTVSDRAQQAQTAVQDLQTSLANVKAGLVTTVGTAVTRPMARIDAALAGIQDTVNKYQATVASTQKRVTATSNSILVLIDVGTVSLTLLFIIFALGLVLLMWFCWEFIRTGHFPSLRVMYASNKGAVVAQVAVGKTVSKEPIKEEATASEGVADRATQPEVVEAKESDTSKEVLEEEATTASSEVVEAEKTATSEEAPVAEASANPGNENTAS